MGKTYVFSNINCSEATKTSHDITQRIHEYNYTFDII